MFNPIEIAVITRNIICKNDRRKYYRFRPSRFYGGISTADCVGCCLRCVFCWAWEEVTRPQEHGEFYSPDKVAKRLVSIARRKNLNQLRISGNEPTLCREHLIRVLELIPKDYQFILETNGILIGSDESYAKDLSMFPNLYVRVSLKGTCEEEFSRLTGAYPDGFQMQIKALENLMKYRVNVHPACMISFSPAENIKALRKRLKALYHTFENFEVEEIILYPSFEERLKRLKVSYITGHRPENIPAEQI
ncbi:MAG: molybdenum cofactor biosynthesis protein MoaA [Nitrospirae bacterium CG_4_10_14_0_8_um_filter_41_23]|nr:MAG: molybdenum cofactor biosynthesis protein MoaA [Nitrospirae bacterium CG_4_10_14_0_8_um_filter_41_23]PJA80450.1 MAG: molybdenum cofactor biosynthesis protein MoaA [Nitrospirae bacterium CG_4_9_14_3_um_filter_41_27]